jgi:CysZ protein
MSGRARERESGRAENRRISYRPGVASPFYHFVWGIRFFFSGLRMLMGNPSLLGLSLVPILFTLVLLVLLAFGISWLVGEAISNAFGEELLMTARVLIFVLALLLIYFLYLPVARVLLAPFSEALSRKAHAINSGEMSYQSNLGWGRAIWEGFKFVAFQMVILLIALALGLIFPPVGAPIGISLAVLTCGLDFLDVPLSARGLPFRKKLGVLWRNKSLTIGFGMAAYLSLLIPVVNLLSLPTGVIGATLLTDAIGES